MLEGQCSFYKALWGNSTLYRSVWYGEKGKPPNKSKWFTDTESALKFATSIAAEPRFNVYHSCALFDSKLRQQPHTKEINSLWVDLDLKDTSCATIKELATMYLPKFAKFLYGLNFWVIATGRGLHIYWMLDKAIASDEWLIQARNLRDYCKSNNIPVDPTRTCDSASLMRVPDSWNMKDDEPKKIIIVTSGTLNTFIAEKSQETTLKLDSNIKFDKEDFNLNQEFGTNNLIESDANTVADMCPLIGQFRSDGLDDSEPLWHFALGVVHNCVDGDKVAHMFSSKSPRYNETETTKKLATIEANSIGPCLCETFESHGCTHCANCPHKGKIKTPIQLGIINHTINDTLVDINNDKQKKRAMQLIDLAPNGKWSVGENGVFKTVDDINVVVSLTPFFVINKFCEDVNDATIITALIRAHTKIGIIVFKIPLKTIADERKLISEFNARGIFPYHKKYFREYITAYMHNISHIKPIKAVNSLGWQHDDSFVYSSSGDAFTHKGDKQNCIIDLKATGYIKGFEAKGSLDEWRKVIDIYHTTPVFNPHLFSLLCSLGAPLLPLTSVKGFILSLQGESGSGKTLSHAYAMSVWGDPSIAGSIGTKDTNTSMLARLGAIKNLPLRLDEATTLSATKLSGLVYELVNGRGRARAAIDGSLSNTAFEWQTLTLITTNRPLLEHDTTQITEAERYRILELSVDMPPEMMHVGRLIGDTMEQNYGIAGKLFIEWVIRNKGTTQQILDIYFDKFKEHVDDSKRFWVSCGAVAFAAATIAEKIGLFKIDIGAHYKWFTKVLQNQTTINEEFILESRGFTSKEELVDALRDSLGGHILVMNKDGTPIVEPAREIKALIVQGDKGTANLYVRGPILNGFIKTHFTDSVKKVRSDLDIHESKSIRVGSRKGRFYEFSIRTNSS